MQRRRKELEDWAAVRGGPCGRVVQCDNGMRGSGTRCDTKIGRARCQDDGKMTMAGWYEIYRVRLQSTARWNDVVMAIKEKAGERRDKKNK